MADPTEKLENFYTVKQVADLLQKSPATILRYCRSGRLQGAKVGNTWRIPQRAIKELLGMDPEKEVR